MDSLLASYASSDEEEDKHLDVGIPSSIKPSSSSHGLSSLPQPKSSSTLTFSLPPPKSHLSIIQTPPPFQTQTRVLADTNIHDGEEEEEEEEEERISDSSFQFGGNPKTTTRFFSSLPEPKSNLSNTQILTPIMSSSDRSLNKRVVVQIKPPMVNPPSKKPFSVRDDDDEEDDELTERRKEPESSSIQTHSVKSFLSSIPAPKNARATLGALPPSSGSSGRRSIIIDADVPASTVEEENEASVHNNNTTTTGNYEQNWVDGSSSSAAYGALDGQSGSVMTGGDPSTWLQGNENYGNYDSYYESHASVGQYDNNSFDGSVTEMPKSFVKTHYKRGRNEVPTDIVEVKQDELMKNRPREDQVKLTGIAFGPAYQPASSKGKPTKLHKRKHQIGSLYFDMKQKEMELSERRAKGFLTKAETHAKYGW